MKYSGILSFTRAILILIKGFSFVEMHENPLARVEKIWIGSYTRNSYIVWVVEYEL